MALRSSWDGFLKLSLISVPVRAFNVVVAGGGEIHFHQLHKNCGQRIRYQKVCPIHGEVTKEEIIQGYQYEKDQYLELAPGEVAKLKAQKDKTLNIHTFIPPDVLDPIYYSGRTYFLTPDGQAGQKPYALLHQVMREKNRCALASLVLSGQEEMAVIRPAEKLLVMTVLHFAVQIKAIAPYEAELGQSKLTAQELKLAGTLVDESTTEKIDFAHFKDEYTERVRQTIDAKLAGKTVASPQREKGARIINLMDALRKSLKTRPEKRKRSPGKRKAS